MQSRTTEYTHYRTRTWEFPIVAAYFYANKPIYTLSYITTYLQ